MDDNKEITEPTETTTVETISAEGQEVVETPVEQTLEVVTEGGESANTETAPHTDDAVHLEINYGKTITSENTYKEQLEALQAKHDAYLAKIEADNFITNYLNKGDNVSIENFISQYHKEDFTSKVQHAPFEIFSLYQKMKYPFATDTKIEDAFYDLTDGASIDSWDDLKLSQQAILMEYASALGKSTGEVIDYASKSKETTLAQFAKNKQEDEAFFNSIKGKKIYTDENGKTGYQVTENETKLANKFMEDLDKGNVPRSEIRKIALAGFTSANSARIASESKVSSATEKVLKDVSNAASKGQAGRNIIPAAADKTPSEESKLEAFASAQAVRNPDGTLKM